MREVPKITEGCLLYRSHEGFVILCTATRIDLPERLGLRSVTLNCHHFVPALLIIGANKIAVQSLSDRLSGQSLVMTVNLISTINMITRHRHRTQMVPG